MELTTTIDLKTKQSEVVVPSLQSMNFIKSYARTFSLLPKSRKEEANAENEFIKELD